MFSNFSIIFLCRPTDSWLATRGRRTVAVCYWVCQTAWDRSTRRLSGAVERMASWSRLHQHHPDSVRVWLLPMGLPTPGTISRTIRPGCAWRSTTWTRINRHWCYNWGSSVCRYKGDSSSGTRNCPWGPSNDSESF